MKEAIGAVFYSMPMAFSVKFLNIAKKLKKIE